MLINPMSLQSAKLNHTRLMVNRVFAIYLNFLYTLKNLEFLNIYDLLVENHNGILGLECRLCHRSFSNRRQILKHICLGEEEMGDAEENNGKE